MTRRERKAKDNAAEYGDYTDGDGWMYCSLVAHSVERGVNVATGALPSVPGKVSIKEFARLAQGDEHVVARHLDAWDRLAEETGVVPKSSTLRPADVPKTPLPDNLAYPYAKYAEARPSNRDRDAEAVRRVEPSAIVKSLTPAKRAELAREVVKADLPEDTRVNMVEKLIDTGGIEEELAAGRAIRRVSMVDADHARELDRQAEKREKEEHESNNFLRSLEVQAELRRVRDALRRAMQATHNGRVDFTDAERVELQDDIRKTRAVMQGFLATLDMLGVAVTTDTNIDWDAEMRKMSEETL